MLSMRQERSGGEGLRLKTPQRCGTYFERKMPFPKNVFRTSNSNTVKRQYGEIEWTVVEKASDNSKALRVFVPPRAPC